MKIAIFDTDLTEEQWKFLEPMLPTAKSTGRPRTPLREVFNACIYLSRAGCQWRLLPSNFPPWKTVHHIFRQWSKAKMWSALNDQLRAHARALEDKIAQPTAAVLDSQTVRSAGHGGEVGYDAGKKTKGRKRFLLVDTLGLILAVTVVPASTQERDGAKAVLEPVLPHYNRLKKLWVDGGYSGANFADWVTEHRKALEVEVIKRSDDTSGFKLLPKRWVVERTFGWLMNHRRLVRDYEKTACSACSWIFTAMISLMLNRLA